MKRLTTLLTILTLALSCAAQEPQTILAHLDSLNSVIDNLKTERINLNNIILSKDDVISSKDDEINNLLSAQVNNKIADTASIVLSGLNDETITTVSKTGENITITIKNGNKRITSIFSEGERKSFFMNDDSTSYTRASYQLDINDMPTFFFNPDKLDINEN